jgi:hypothetical protein
MHHISLLDNFNQRYLSIASISGKNSTVTCRGSNINPMDDCTLCCVSGTMATCMTSNTILTRNVPCQISSRRQTARRAIPVVCKAQESDARVGGAQQAFAVCFVSVLFFDAYESLDH